MKDNNITVKTYKLPTMRSVLLKKIGQAIALTIFLTTILLCAVYGIMYKYTETDISVEYVAICVVGICFIGIIMGIIISRIITNQIMKPIENINVEKPETSTTYTELKPILKRMNKQRAFIKEQTITEKETRERMRREFSANVSHELKTPLTSISGYAELMKAGLAKQEDMIRFSEIIHSEATRMITLVNDIIMISKLDEEETEVEWVLEEVDLYELANKCKNTLKITADKRKVTISVLGDSTVVVGEKYLLQEMMHNIVENAIKYNKENGIVVIKVGDEDGHKIIEVSDTGIGIGPQDKSRVFERFYRVDKSHSSSVGGTGLGLSIVKHAAIFHNATISLDSELGKGTTIKIVF